MATRVSSVGAYLRDLRERRGVPLAEISRATRVAPRYLEALEADAFDRLPPPVFIRGFIRAYCQVLAEPPDEALASFEGRPGGPPPAPRAAAPTPARGAGAEPRSRSAVLASLVLLVVLGMALFTVALLLQPRDRTERSVADARPPAGTTTGTATEPAAPAFATSAVPAAPPGPVGGPVPAPTNGPRPGAVAATPPAPTTPPAAAAPPAPRSTPPPAAPAAAPAPSPRSPAAAAVPRTPEAPPAAAPAVVTAAPPGVEAAVNGVAAPYRLVARTSEATWIRVRTEDGRSSEENVPAGEIREWVSDRPFVLTIGNAAGVSLELNGRALPPLGGKGTVVPRLVLPPEAR